MIIVADKNTEKTIYFPKNLYKENKIITTDFDYTLILVNRGTNKQYKFNLNDEGIASYGFYSFNLNFSELPNGEYEYTIISNNEIIIPYETYDIDFGKLFYSNGDITQNYRFNIYKYNLDSNYDEFNFYFSTKYRSSAEDAFVANYLDENGNLIRGEYEINGQYDEKILNIPQNAKSIWFNAPAFITIGDYFTVIKKSKKKDTMYSKGLIRLNELKLETNNYNDNRTYIAYDKQ